MEFALIFVAGVIVSLTLVAGLIFAVQKHEKERAERIRTIADEMGLQFSADGDSVVSDAIGHLRLFNQGQGRKFSNMISGQADDVEIAMFGYRFTTGGGNQRQTHQQSVICFQSPLLALPDFEIRPESVFHKIGKALGYQDINFDSHPVFSKRFLLRGPEETAIREFFRPDILEFFESRQGVSVEASGDRLIYYRARKRIKPEEVKPFMEEGFQVYALLTSSTSGQL